MVNLGLNYKDKVSQLISWGHWFSFFNIALALIIASRYLFAATWPETIIGQFYLVLSWLGHFSFLIFIFYLLVLFPLSFLIPKQKALRFIGAFVATVGLSILALDTEIFAQFHRHLNPYYFSMISSAGENEQAQSWHLFYILLPLLFILELVFSNLIWRKRKRLNKYRIGSGASVFFLICFLLTHLIYIWADAAVYKPIVAQKINYPVSYPMTAKSFLIEHGLIETPNASSGTLFPKEHGKFTYPLRSVHFETQKKKLNVILLVVDSLRFDMLNPTNMPNLWKFSQSSLRYTSHYSGSNNATQGVFSLFYGLPSHYQRDVVSSDANSILVETFSQQRYDIYQGNNVQAKNTFGFSRDFKQQLMSGSAIHNKGASGDIEMLSEWQAWFGDKTELSARDDSPWLSYLRFNSAANYQVPDNFNSPFNQQQKNITQLLMTDGDKQALFPAYSNSVYFIDSLLGKAFATLKDKGQLNNTLVIVTGANGQEFNDTRSNAWGSASNFSDFQSKVPLVMHWPNQQAKVITQDTSHLDIVPTLMQNILGVSTSVQSYSSGQDLLELPIRDWLLLGGKNQYAILHKQMLVQFNRTGDYQVFDRRYHKLDEPYKQTQILLQVVHELQRFYKSTENKPVD